MNHQHTNTAQCLHHLDTDTTAENPLRPLFQFSPLFMVLTRSEWELYRLLRESLLHLASRIPPGVYELLAHGRVTISICFHIRVVHHRRNMQFYCWWTLRIVWNTLLHLLDLYLSSHCLVLNVGVKFLDQSMFLGCALVCTSHQQCKRVPAVWHLTNTGDHRFSCRS